MPRPPHDPARGLREALQAALAAPRELGRCLAPLLSEVGAGELAALPWAREAELLARALVAARDAGELGAGADLVLRVAPERRAGNVVGCEVELGPLREPSACLAALLRAAPHARATLRACAGALLACAVERVAPELLLGDAPALALAAELADDDAPLQVAVLDADGVGLPEA